jgi:hypothetical protein
MSRPIIATMSIAFAITFITAGYDANAYRKLTTADCPNGVHWSADPTLTINTNDYNDIARASIAEVAARIATVGGQSLDIYTEYYAGCSSGDHCVYMDNQGATGHLATTTRSWSTSTCHFIDADICQNTYYGFVYDMPEDNSDHYYQQPIIANGYSYYFRPLIMHEILHVAGLNHEPYDYAFMNYNTRAWTNRSSEKQIEPLPDDRQGLRAIYGNSVTECDIAVTNSWDENGTDPDPAHQYPLCEPAKGTGWNSDIFGTHCAASPTHEVCPGDTFYARFAVLNYGTESHLIDQRIWFSTNNTLETAVDIKAPNYPDDTVSANASYLPAYTWTVPSTVSYDTYYYLIVRATIDPDDPKLCDESVNESTQNNWMPLRARLHVKPANQC